MNKTIKYIWPFLFFIVCGLLFYQTYKTNQLKKDINSLISASETIESNYNHQLSMISFYNKFIEKLSFEHNKYITKQLLFTFFTYNNYCYLKEVSIDDDCLLWLIKEKDYSVKYDSVFELIDCGYYFLFFKENLVGTIDIWSPNEELHLDWYLRNHEVFKYE